MSDEKVLMIDPPSGWQFGYPKSVPAEVPKRGDEFTEWYKQDLIESGYPAKDLDFALKHSRYWWADAE